ncbi:proline--tRNA ligase, partial [Treponema sp. R6D11]
WQEGHTVHETAEQAIEETIKMLNVYSDFCREFLAIPVIKGQKTDKEKFAGAQDTYTIEALMYDGKALQAGTSHYFGDGFAKAFDIKYLDRDNKLQYVHQTSWGVSTRIIGAVIMVHSDNNGLVLPPKLAPTQAVVIPIASNKEGVAEKCNEVYESVKDVARVKLDDSDNSPGWKFSEYEMRGVPVRIEIGPRDIEAGVASITLRHSYEKLQLPLDKLAEELPLLLERIHNEMYEQALSRLTVSEAKTLDELVDIAENKKGFIKAMWCGALECEEKIKEHGGITSRCIPFEQEKVAETCVCCGKPAEKMVYWGKAY